LTSERYASFSISVHFALCFHRVMFQHTIIPPNEQTWSSRQVIPFCEEWDYVQTIGEGSFGEVRLLLNRCTREAVAVKVIKTDPENEESVRNAHKEALICKTMRHENVIASAGYRKENNIYYIFLEYAQGGELYDRIEPDVGTGVALAHKYFLELLSGIEYVHNQGIAHRDLKPENLLISSTGKNVGYACILTSNLGVLKISDFGMATVFRNKHGRVRKLGTRCGTFPYMAPEVITGSYDAEPADIWSCGVILVAMLTGELPWDTPESECERYAKWVEGKCWNLSPWRRIDCSALSLIKNILRSEPEKRMNIKQILKHKWCLKDFSKKSFPVEPLRLKSLCNDDDKKRRGKQPATVCSSQPVNSGKRNVDRCFNSDEGTSSKRPHMDSDFNIRSFSQPSNFDNLLLSSQSTSQPSNLDAIDKLVKRMTRLEFSLPPDEAVNKVEEACSDAGMGTVRASCNELSVTTVDSRRNPLSIKVTAYAMKDLTMIDFRLSKGDGIDFKRTFKLLKERLNDSMSLGHSVHSECQPSTSQTSPQ
ncbi:Serine/threonine-protein kinase Chk1, partial [Trichinella sp. T9]